MTILLTGSSGFIGKNLESALREKFHGEEIVALKRRGKHSPSEPPFGANYSYVDYSDITSLLGCKKCRDVDYVFHLAGITKGLWEKDFFEANVLATKNLLSTLMILSPNLKRFVLMSSQAAAGPSMDRWHYKRENEENNPIEYYGQSKLAAERVVAEYSGILPCTILRPCSVYGPGDRDFLNIFKMGKSRLNIYAANKRKCTSIICVDDLVDLIIKAMLSDKSIGETYNACNDEPATWQQIHETIFKVMKEAHVIDKDPVSISLPYAGVKALSYFGNLVACFTGEPGLLNVQKVRTAKPKFWIISNNKAKEDLGFNQRISLEQGMKKTLEYYLSCGLIK